MTIKINPWLFTAVLIGVGILIFTLFRGCNQSKLRLQAEERLKHSMDSVKKDNIRKQAISDSAKKDYQDTMALIKGQYDLVQNQKERLENDIEIAHAENKKLIAKYKANNYTDTAMSSVPNEFISDCKDCFDRLETETLLVDRFKKQVKISDSIKLVTGSVYEKRIRQQEQEKQSLQTSLEYCIGENEKAQKKLAPKGQLYFAWGVLFNPIIPKMAGVGLMYQDKHKVIYAAKGWFGQFGNMWEANMNLPLSFKRK